MAGAAASATIVAPVGSSHSQETTYPPAAARTPNAPASANAGRNPTRRRSAPAAGSVRNANTGSAPSTRAAGGMATPMVRNSTASQSCTGMPSARAVSGSNEVNAISFANAAWTAVQSAATTATIASSAADTATAL